MGRVFEKRKHTMFARFDRMAKAFTRIGKDIAMAVKNSGPNPDNNPKLRMAIRNAKGVNMPKDRVDAAIKRASSKEEKDLKYLQAKILTLRTETDPETDDAMALIQKAAELFDKKHPSEKWFKSTSLRLPQ